MTELAQAAVASWQRPAAPATATATSAAGGSSDDGSGRSLGWQDVFDVVVRWRQAGSRHKHFNLGIFEVNKWKRSSGTRDKRLRSKLILRDDPGVGCPSPRTPWCGSTSCLRGRATHDNLLFSST